LKIEGYIDSCSVHGIFGWVLDRDHPQQRLRLRLYRDTKPLGDFLADRFRQDLADGQLGDGCCAFEIALPPLAGGTDLGALRLYVLGTDYFFPLRVGRPVSGQTAAETYAEESARLHSAGLHWRKFPNCLLHIGTEKTGSTSLQRFFAMNREVMLDNGYFVPRSLAPASDDAILNHSRLATLSMSDHRFDDDLRREEGVVDGPGLNQYRRGVFADLCREIASAPPGCRTLLLSNEHCHSRLETAEEVRNLWDFVRHFGEATRVVVYLRPQHELAMSQYGMSLANGICDIDMFPPLPPPAGYGKREYTNRSHFDYAALLDRWSQVFGERSVEPRIYSAASMKDGDVISDFAYRIALPDCPRPAKRWNTNVTARAQAFLVEFHRMLDALEGPGAPLLRARVRNAVLARFPGSGALPARAEAKAFFEQFAEGNEAVRHRWFAHLDQLFDVDFGKYPEAGEAVVLGARELLEMFVQILLQDQSLEYGLRTADLQRMLEERRAPRPGDDAGAH
jgi:hypothetical protein